MRFLIFTIFFLECFAGFSQNLVTINLTVLDSESKDEIQGASVILTQNNKISKGKTNKQGRLSFEVEFDKSMEISVKHGFYADFKRTFSPSDFQDSKFPKTIELELTPKTQDIQSVDAQAHGTPLVLFKSEKLSVADFEILPNSELLLLLYPKTLKKGSQLGILSNRKITFEFEMPEKPLELIHDFRGNPHVVCENGVYGVHKFENRIGISTHDKNYFMKYIFPIVDTNYTKYYFSNFNKNYPAFDYQIYDQLDSSYANIIEIKDELMMELYRSEYKWVDVRTKLWAKNLELETGIDKEIWVGANYFTQSIYYKELYAPMFKNKDSIYVFDYYKDQLFKFNLLGVKCDSISIFHHYSPKKSGWKKNVIQDKVTEDIYAFFEKDGNCSLKKINLQTGEFEREIKFNHQYIDKFAIHNYVVYYIYRPLESAQKKFLYEFILD